MNCCSGRRSVFLGILLFVGMLLGSSGQEDSPKEQAAALAKKARKAARSNQPADAYLLYSEASALQPTNKKWKRNMEVLQSRAARQSQPVPPVPTGGEAIDPLLAAPAIIAPEDVFDSLTARDYARARQPQAPPQLKAGAGTQDFNVSGSARTLFDRVAQSFGLETVYDGDYPAAGPQFRFRVSGIDYRE